MITIYTSNNLKKILHQVCHIIKCNPLTNPLQQELFIVPNKSTEKWMKNNIAKIMGIYANIKFNNYENFILNIFQKILPKETNKFIFTSSHIFWQLLSMPTLHNYLQYHLFNKDIQKINFAHKISQLFHQYLIHRSKWINSWYDSNDQIFHSCSTYKHQQNIWKNLLIHKQNTKQNINHFVNIKKKIITLLTKKPYNTKNLLPNRFFIFYTLKFPQEYISILHAIGKHVKIYIFLQSFYNNKITSINNVKKNKENFLSKYKTYIQHQLKNINYIAKKRINIFHNQNCNNLLQKIQNQYYMNSYHTFSSIDNSINIHVCNSMKQEIEILHKNLHNIFTNNKLIHPKDIIVLSNNIDDYIPYIYSIFNSKTKKKFIPFNICSSINNSNPEILTILNEIFHLSNNDFRPEKIISLISSQIISEQFKFSITELEYLKIWIDEVGIKLGVDQYHLKKLININVDNNTWMFGIKRTLLGHAINDSDIIWNNIVPYYQYNNEYLNSIIKIKNFITLLKKWKKILSQSRTLTLWEPLFQEIVHDFFPTHYIQKNYLFFLNKKWNYMIKEGTENLFQKKINSKTIYTIFLKYINNNHYFNFFSDAINFCNINLIENIPFKIIYLIGMNDHSFPKTKHTPTFNLIQKYPNINDVSDRQYDIHIFMNCLLNAQEYFYLSYISDYKNPYCNQSILINQLINFIIQQFKISKNYKKKKINKTKNKYQENILNHLYHIHNK
ncbi:MAG: exodeoxyribonuclease V subunit gamma [Buchnera aphidicola (Eriosoma harunire)]